MPRRRKIRFKKFIQVTPFSKKDKIQAQVIETLLNFHFYKMAMEMDALPPLRGCELRQRYGPKGHQTKKD